MADDENVVKRMDNDKAIKKIPYDEYIKTATLFFICDRVESQFLKEIDDATSTLVAKMGGILTEDGLKEYIQCDTNSIDNLLSIMNISSEKFKRVITTLRIEKGHRISGEWDLKKIRRMMIERPSFMDEVCDLLRSGSKDEKYKSIIPSFYLENFRIDNSTIARLSNPDDLRRLIKKGIEGKYNISIGNAYALEIEKKIAEACYKRGILFEKNKKISTLGKTFDYVIFNSETAAILIMSSYNITTSSTQTRYKESAENAAAFIREYNKSHTNKMVLVNILDGAGWVGRQSDLRAIYLCSTYLLNIKTINQLDDIVQYYC